MVEENLKDGWHDPLPFLLLSPPPSCGSGLIFCFPGPLNPPCYSVFSFLHLPSQQAQLPYLLGAWAVDQGRICRGRKGRDKPMSWYERSGNMAHAAGVEGVQMAISFTVIEGCANLGM